MGIEPFILGADESKLRLLWDIFDFYRLTGKKGGNVFDGGVKAVVNGNALLVKDQLFRV